MKFLCPFAIAALLSVLPTSQKADMGARRMA